MPVPTPRLLVGLAAGAFAAFLPGALEWQVSPQLRATGAIALVILVIFLRCSSS